MILWTEFLTVCRIEVAALLHVFPADEILHGTCETTVSVESDVEQQVFLSEALDVEGYVIVYLVYCQTNVQRLYLLVVSQHAYVRVILSFLYGQEQIAIFYLHALHSVAFA